MHDDVLTFGPWLQRHRQGLRLTRDQLGHLAGCSGNTIKKIETELRRPSLDLARMLAAALEIPSAEQDAFVRFARGVRSIAPVLTAESDVTSRYDAPSPDRADPPPSGPGPAPGHTRLHNLPVLRDPLIGREREVAEVVALLHRPEVGLVTLMGSGGVGKTRLSQAIAMELLPPFTHQKSDAPIGLEPGGVWFVDLVPITDPDLVLSAIAQVLSIKEIAGQSMRSAVRTSLEAKHVLLVLDNCEHLPSVATVVSDLLQGAPGLRVLATSRVPLNLRDEYQVSVPPLELPRPGQALPVEGMMQYAAVALFVQRVGTVKRDFQLTSENAAAVAEICAHLDGLPLAIELAAARACVFSPQALRARFAQGSHARLQLLTGGARDLPVRHQTMRETIAWSYDLLDVGQQRLFRRLAVFVGNWTLDIVEAVGAGAGDLSTAVLDGLTALVQHSLIRRVDGPDGEARFQWLETIREYALERLALDPEAAAIRRAHAAYYLALAERVEPELQGTDQRRWLDLLEREHDNLRAALGWCVQNEAFDWGLRLAAALTEFWWPRDHLAEGRQWLTTLLRAGTEAEPVLRANALYQAGQLAYGYGDTVEAEALVEGGLALYGVLGDRRGMARALRTLAEVATIQQDSRAASLREEALALFRELDDIWGVAWMLYHIGQHEPDAARRMALYRESIALARSRGYIRPLVHALNGLAGEMHIGGDLDGATRLYGESLALSQELDDRWTMAWARGAVGALARDMGDLTSAIAHYEESLALHRRSGNQTGTAIMLVHLGDVLRWQGQYVWAKERYRESLRLLQHVHALECCALVLNCLGRVAMLEEDIGEAQLCFRASLVQCQAAQDDALAAAVLGVMAGAALHAQHVFDDELFAARLSGAIADRPRSPMIPPQDRTEDARSLEEIVGRLGEGAWEQAWVEGRAMTLEQAIAYALVAGKHESRVEVS